MANTGHRGWGKIRQLPSGRWQASYIGPDTARHVGTTTYDGKDAAVVWLTAERKLIESDNWTPPKTRQTQAKTDSFEMFARSWVANRRTRNGVLKPRTKAGYTTILDRILVPAFGPTPVRHISPGAVDAWYADLDPKTPTQNTHAYALLRSILNTAVEKRMLVSNPCQIRGAGNAKRAREIRPATLEELAAIVKAVPQRYKAMILLACWCAMRFGELTELRRSDLDMTRGVVKIRRAVVWVSGESGTVPIVDTPKSAAGIRDVAIPPHILPAIRDHLRQMPMTGKDALLFPAARDPYGHMRPATLTKVFYRAREKAGRTDLAFHHLRHTGATRAAEAGATLAELMGRLGHSTPRAAMEYQHAAAGRDAIIAAKLSEMAGKS